MARPVARSLRDASDLPKWIQPQLAELVDEAAEGPQWLQVRRLPHACAHRARSATADPYRSRLAHKYSAIAEAVSSLRAMEVYLDGELCGGRPDRTTSFTMIQAASDSGNGAGLVFFLFDLLCLDGEDV